MATRSETKTYPCPRCDLTPVKTESALCLECQAQEMAAAAESNAPAPGAIPLPGVKLAPTGPSDSKTASVQASAAKLAPTVNARPAASQGPKAPGISSGRKDAPMRIVIYGVHGAGKTRFMVDAPKSIIIPAEAGAEGFEVARFDEPHPPRTFEEVIDHVRWLQVADHDYQTLGIDTADMVEQFAYQLAIRKFNKSDGRRGGVADNIEEVGGGYKKGYIAAAEEWRRLLAELERLRQLRKMHIIIAAHSKVMKFANPAGEDYDRYSLKLHPEAGQGLVQEWADAVLFATFKTSVQRQGKRGKAKGVGGKERVLYTQHDAAYEAKNRYDLPAALPLDWASFQAAVEENKSPDLLHAAITRALERLGGEVVEVKGQPLAIADWVQAQLDQKPDNRRLAQIKNRLEARVEALEEERAEQEEAARAAGDVTS